MPVFYLGPACDWQVKTRTLLQTVAEGPEESLRRGLTHLQAAEFLYEARLFPDLEYTFKHALTHEVAYGSVLQDRRRALHARIVDAIEALHPERLTEQVERLAHHAVRGERWERRLVSIDRLRGAVMDSARLRCVLQHSGRARSTDERAHLLA